MIPHTTLVDARKSHDFNESEGGRWVTFCETHNEFCQHQTRNLAREFLGVPEEWCEVCRELHERTMTRLALKRKFTDTDFILLDKLAEVIREAQGHATFDLASADKAAEALVYAEIAAGTRQVVYHLAQFRGVEPVDLWTAFDI